MDLESRLRFTSNSNNKVRSYSCTNSSTKMGKNEEMSKNFSGLQNRAREITKRGSFRDLKSGQKNYKSVFKSRFQIGAETTNWGKRDFKSGQGLQIGAEQH